MIQWGSTSVIGGSLGAKRRGGAEDGAQNRQNDPVIRVQRDVPQVFLRLEATTHFKEHEGNQRANCSPESETEWSIDSVTGVQAPRLKLTSPLSRLNMIVILPCLQISCIRSNQESIQHYGRKVVWAGMHELKWRPADSPRTSVLQ